MQLCDEVCLLECWRYFCLVNFVVRLLQDPTVFENPDDSKSMAIQRTNLQVNTRIILILTVSSPAADFGWLCIVIIRRAQVVNITSPANFFHVLRRQIHRDFRKPLVVMTPKSLLRHPLARSTYEEMATGTRFRSVIHDDETQLVERSKVKKLLLCSGKVYFDLLERKLKDKRHDVAISRIEQVSPSKHQNLHSGQSIALTLRRFAPSLSMLFVKRSIVIPTRKFLGFR